MIIVNICNKRRFVIGVLGYYKLSVTILYAIGSLYVTYEINESKYIT